MQQLKLTVAYEGTNYCGWQYQINGITIQEIMETNLARLAGEQVKLIAAGRTDAGVHARGQVVGWTTGLKIPLARLPLAINSCLPADIIVRSAEVALPQWHARSSAISKTYWYLIDNQKVPDVFLRNYTAHVRHALRVEPMLEAARYLVGEHDFTSFCASGSTVKNNVRSLYECDVVAQGQLVIVKITANGFLYHMVRNIVGTLIRIGRGKMAPETIIEILAARNRRRAGQMAPAQGLVLMNVCY